MLKWLHDLDRILRGDATRLTALREGRIDIPIGGLTAVIVLLGLITGMCVGSYSVFRTGGPFFMQLVASTVKVPMLFLLTLVVTFPSLYVFNALVGSRLKILSVLRLLVATLGVTLAVIAAFGPIIAFFSVSTTSYHFMSLLNVLVFAIGGMLGLKFLLQTLHRLTVVSQEPLVIPASEPADTQTAAAETPPGNLPQALPPSPDTGALDRLEGQTLGHHVKTVFRCWVILFGLVGAQMSWVLRPLIGDPTVPFEWFRTRESNFFDAVWHTFLSLFH